MEIKMFNTKKFAALDQKCIFYKEHLCTFHQLNYSQNNHKMYKIVMLHDNK